MKVTFTCGECGWECAIETPTPPYDGRFRSIPMPPHICRSPEPTYGPLTVEMVAEALYAAMQLYPMRGFAPVQWCDAGEDLKEDFRRQARFVIRLLEATRWPRVASSPELWADDCLTDWRDWLLKLAREK